MINKDKNITFAITWPKGAYEALEKVINVSREKGEKVNKSKFLLALFTLWIDSINNQSIKENEEKEEK